MLHQIERIGAKTKAKQKAIPILIPKKALARARTSFLVLGK